jgi:GNAT superfamily N-acetyltransferase
MPVTVFQTAAPDEFHLGWLARLHASALAGDLLPSLGPSFLRHFYSALREGGNGMFYFARENGAPVGALVATRNRSGMRRDLIRFQGVNIAWDLFACSLRRPSLLAAILRASRYGSKEEGMSHELLFLGVDSLVRGRGTGGLLLNAYRTDLSRSGADAFLVVVGSKNEGARRFYVRHGGQERNSLCLGPQSLVQFIFQAGSA